MGGVKRQGRHAQGGRSAVAVPGQLKGKVSQPPSSVRSALGRAQRKEEEEEEEESTSEEDEEDEEDDNDEEDDQASTSDSISEGSDQDEDEEDDDEDDEDGDGETKMVLGRKAMLKRKRGSSPPAMQRTTKGKKAESLDAPEPFRNRQRVLVVASRGVTERHRHLQKDLLSLLPHSFKEAKMDAKDNLPLLHEIADLSNCNNILYLEARKHQDLYMWLSKSPSGPSVKCLVENISTMHELSLHGNCLKGSRPILSFDASFAQTPHLMLMKELLTQIYGTPKGHRKSKPFFDHIMAFSVMDGQRIWVRHYQMQQADEIDIAEGKPMTLTEIGPRFVLHLIRIFEGGFGGPTLWQNGDYVSPNEVRQMSRQETGNRYADRKRAALEHAIKVRDHAAKEDELDRLFKTTS